MAREIDVRASLQGPMQFNVSSATGHTIALDVPSGEGGEDRGPTPMELLLMSLAGCTGMDVISILHKQRQQVVNYEVKVHGTRAEAHPRVYIEVTVEHIVTGHDLDPQAVRRAIELSSSKYCSVSQTVAKTAKITTSFEVRESSDSSAPSE
jgi:putative redox protein